MKAANNFMRALALVLACSVAFFAVQLVVHGHDKGQNDAACRICHAAHFDSGPGISALLLEAPMQSRGYVREIPAKFHKDIFAHDAPSRAPPAA